MARVGAVISLDWVAVHPHCWCVCLCYLHFAPENPEDGKMYLQVLAHPGCPGQSPESRKTIVCVWVQAVGATAYQWGSVVDGGREIVQQLCKKGK